MYAQSIRERIDASLRGETFPTALPEACWWAGRRALGNLNLDLEHDDCQKIASTFERWELVESYSHFLIVNLVAAMHARPDVASEP